MSTQIEDEIVFVNARDNVIPLWAAHYKGLPWKLDGFDKGGINNWTLFRLIYVEQYNITLPICLNYTNQQIFGNLHKNWNTLIYDDVLIGDLLVFGSCKDPIFAIALTKGIALLIQTGKKSFIYEFDRGDLVLAYRYFPNKDINERY